MWAATFCVPNLCTATFSSVNKQDIFFLWQTSSLGQVYFAAKFFRLRNSLAATYFLTYIFDCQLYLAPQLFLCHQGLCANKFFSLQQLSQPNSTRTQVGSDIVISWTTTTPHPSQTVRTLPGQLGS